MRILYFRPVDSSFFFMVALWNRTPVACNKLTSPTGTQFFDLSCILATYNETINMAIIAVCYFMTYFYAPISTIVSGVL